VLTIASIFVHWSVCFFASCTRVKRSNISKLQVSAQNFYLSATPPSLYNANTTGLYIVIWTVSR